MHVISFRKLREFWERYPDAEEPLRRWYRISKKADWKNLTETRRELPHADRAGVCTIFNIKGNDYRLVSKIYYPNKTLLVRAVFSHAEYDEGGWKNDCEC